MQPVQRFQRWQELMSRSQERTESVAHYVDEIGNLCFKLDISQEETMHYFIKGLRQNIRQYVVRSQTQDLTAAIAAAQAEEAAQYADKADNFDISSLVDKVVQKLSLADSNPKISTIQGRQSITCQICQVGGHLARQCPNFMPYPYSAPMRPPQASGNYPSYSPCPQYSSTPPQSYPSLIRPLKQVPIIQHLGRMAHPQSRVINRVPTRKQVTIIQHLGSMAHPQSRVINQDPLRKQVTFIPHHLKSVVGNRGATFSATNVGTLDTISMNAYL